MALKACVFCGAKPTTLEHIWPVWLGDLFRNELRPDVATWKVNIPQVQRTTESIDAQVRAVCEPCNNRWMSNLEKRAKKVLIPMLKDEPRTLVPSQCVTLAAWAFKTMLMLECAHPEVPIAPRHHFQSFYRRKHSPPPGTLVWLSAYIGGAWPIVYQRARLYDEHNGPRIPRPTAYLSTINVSHVTFQMLCPIGVNDTAAHPGEAGGLTRTIWPRPRGNVRWPTPIVLDDDGLWTFAARFGGD